MLFAILLSATGLCVTAQERSNVYLDLMEKAVSAYSDARIASFVAEVERDGVQEHGFPRLAANLGVLVANGRLADRKPVLARMLTAACRDARKGKMPPKSGGNEFSVKELVQAVVALEKAGTFPRETTDRWRADLTAVTAADCYTTGRLKVGEPVARNWVVFAAASEQARLAHGMGGDAAFVERYVKDQLRWFDANGMYRDPNQPAVYDFVTRLQFMHILDWGYDGPSRGALEMQIERSAEPTLKMQSACGEIPYGGRSNQFLHNNTFYAAVCEWYAARFAKRGEKERAARFAAAARRATEALRPWLAESPVSHVKNRYPREEGKGVFSAKGDMGCERYAYFDKYMVTMGSWAMGAWSFATCAGETPAPPTSPSVFVTTPDFHFVFLSAGDYSAQLDYNADSHYDCDGLGRLQRRGAPGAICLSTPCAKNPSYRIETPNDAALAFAPVVAGEPKLELVGHRADDQRAVTEWKAGSVAWTVALSSEGLSATSAGEGKLAVTLPAFAFDGRESSVIKADERTLTIAYRGWICRYETDGKIVDTGRSACNRNGRYRRFEARGERKLAVRVSIARKPLMTEWGEKVTPENAWREYPRPQMVRENWTCLNGLWDYVITSTTAASGSGLAIWEPPGTSNLPEEVARGKILVPFAFESALSGVGRLVEPNEKMVYSRTVELHPRPGRRILLNFEAVDWRASVFVNGQEATDAPHEGGSLPFTVDVTPFVRDGSNELKVVAWDPTHTYVNAGGKQSDRSSGCFYTRVSGIWQTVWMEEVPETYISGYRVTTDIDRGEVVIKVKVEGEGQGEGGGRVSISAFDGDRKIGEFTPLSSSAFSLRLDSFECWSPAHPKLYGFTAKLGEDTVRGYFAMRKIDRAQDAKGNWRFRLNNEIVFPMGTLDQGWWPDGLLTPPSLAACEHDIRTLKDCGFDMLRKHIKVEPRAYYALCDRLGIMVFQDAPSPVSLTNVFDGVKSQQRYGMFRREWKEQIDLLRNVPSIVMWIPYNETWGQPDAEYTRDTLRWTKRYDPTRLVGGPSGYNDYDGGDGIVGADLRRDVFPEAEDPVADTVDRHDYPGPSQCREHARRISLLGEFGGLGLKVPGHMWNEKSAWGYQDADAETTRRHYDELMEKLLPLVKDGLGGTVYTQTSDVEQEVNGLMTYDRKVLKFDPKRLRTLHDKVRAAAPLAGVCLCGEVPERANDFFWENDRVGFRAYGPGDVHKWSGIDVFNKSVSTNIVVHWLKNHAKQNFHLNHGQGMDNYAVGPGRGVGGVALRKDGKWLPDYGNWVAYRVKTNCDEVCAFELDYKLPIGGIMTFQIEMRRGTSFFHEYVLFSPDVPLEGVEVAIGIDTSAERLHTGDLFVDKKRGIISLFEEPHTIKDNKRTTAREGGEPIKGEEGSMMSAIIAVAGDYEIVEGPCGETMLLGKKLPRRKSDGSPVVDVLVGADWTEAGRFRTAEEWHDYVRTGKEKKK